MIRAVRIVVGMALGLVVVIAPAWGLFHLVRQGSCGDVGMPTCPDEVGGWIVAMVLSLTIGGPLAVAIAGGDGRGRPLLLAPLLWLVPLGLVAAVVVSLTGASSDPDTRWVGILIGGLAGLLLLLGIRGALRARRKVAALAAAAGTPPSALTMSQLAEQLNRVAAAKQSAGDGATPPAASASRRSAAASDSLAARLRRLNELHEQGLISLEERDRRRAEILEEI